MPSIFMIFHILPINQLPIYPIVNINENTLNFPPFRGVKDDCW